MPTQPVPPSISKTAFNCPHCCVYTTQYWFKFYAGQNKKNETPRMPTKENKKAILDNKTISQDTALKLMEWHDKMESSLIFTSRTDRHTSVIYDIHNLNLSQCYDCGKIAVWVHDKMIFPNEMSGVNPNPDLPEDIIQDFNEARSIINMSPRGATALLRLCVQKLCIHLGEVGKYINDDIASLVSKGLDPLTQRSLDIVRVIGNDAVHPGTINLKDDKETAEQLLQLINSVADQMISHPKNVNELYGKIPPIKLKGIEDRDKKSRELNYRKGGYHAL